jgi:ribosomal protein L16/L10AE
MNYGNHGLKILNYLFLTAKHMFRYSLVIKRCTKRGSRLLRSYWVNFSINIPLTKQSKGARMGSGKGKLFAWGFKTTGGSFLFELKNTRYGRSVRYLRLLKYILNCDTAILTKKVNKVNNPDGCYLNTYFNQNIYDII